MTDAEIAFRAATLGIGFLLILLGALLTWKTEHEARPTLIMIFGAACIIAATDGVS